MNVLVIGCNGQLGSDMVRVGREQGHGVTGADFPDIDITDAAATRRSLAAGRPDAIINCTGYTAVDKAEVEGGKANAVNRDGVANLAGAARAADALLVHFSTDYVFDGTATRPYVESDACAPCTVYGQSKHAGEQALAAAWPRHQILRIAWLYGTRGANFVKTIVKAGRRCAAEGTPLRVVNDQHGCPTWTVDVCRQAFALIGRQEYGLFHAVSHGQCTWFDFARRIVAAAGIDVAVEPCTTAQFTRPAPRPAWSVLENRRLQGLGLDLMPQWEQAFDAFWSESGHTLMEELT